MADRFDKFTERARRVLTLAQEEAQRFDHNYIGTEHVLLGLLREGDSLAMRVLTNLGVEADRVRTAVEFIIGRGDRSVLGEIGLTPRAKKVVELAVDEARRLNHHYIGTEHLLLGLVREREGIAAGVLESLGVNLERVRAETSRVLRQRPNPAFEETGASEAAPSLTLQDFPGAVRQELLTLTPAAKRAFENAAAEARRTGHRQVGTGHLMLGVLADDDNFLAGALAAMDIDISRLRTLIETSGLPGPQGTERTDPQSED